MLVYGELVKWGTEVYNKIFICRMAFYSLINGSLDGRKRNLVLFGEKLMNIFDDKVPTLSFFYVIITIEKGD